MKNRNFKSLAFTLAEVLIVLAVIGIISALTIPVLIQKAQERENIAKLKKVYSTLSNAFTLAVNSDGTPDNWDLIGSDSSIGAENLTNKIVPYLKVSKYCKTSAGCWYNSIPNYLNGNFDSYD